MQIGFSFCTAKRKSELNNLSIYEIALEFYKYLRF